MGRSGEGFEAEAVQPDPDVIDRWIAWGLENGLVEPGVAQRVRILARLASLPRVSGQELASRLGISRAAVHKHIECLRGEGIQVQSVPGSGYVLQPPSDSLVAEAALPLILSLSFPTLPEWLSGWGDELIGLPYLYLPAAPSTNQLLKDQAQQGLPAGALLVTDHQVAGRGRLGRTWISEAGKDLTFSFLLRPEISPTRVHLVVLAASLAVARVVESVAGLEGRVLIKWPNDVLVDGRKVCGILAESSMDMDQVHWVVVGIGLNVNGDPGEKLSGPAVGSMMPPTSLRLRTGRSVPRANLLARTLRELGRELGSLRRGEVSALLSEYERRDWLKGTRVTVRSGPSPGKVVAEGTAAGLGPDGELLVRQANGELREVMAGEVTLTRPR